MHGEIPRGADMQTIEDQSIFHRRESEVRGYCRRFPSVFVSARGSILRDAQGRDYIDFLAGCSSLNYGHNDPDMSGALIEHIAAHGIALGLDLFTDAKRAFLESFENLILQPCGMDHRVQFTGPTGTNAVEAAMKLARKATGRSNIIAFTNAYHGVSLGALAATGNQYNRMGAMLSGISRAAFDGYFGPDFDTAQALEQLLSDPSSGMDPPAALIVETVQGEGGLNVASPQWLQRIAAIAERHGALLIIDEVQTGCGRCGTYFSFEELGVMPDLVVMSKSLSGYGLPMSLVLVRPRWDVWRPAEHNGTFRGNTHAFVTARVALEKFWSDAAFTETIACKSALVTRRLRQTAEHLPGARLKGRGMMQGLDVASGELADRICRLCFERGLIIETCGTHDQVLKILAPLTTPVDLLEQGLSILHGAVRDLAEAPVIAV
ncbi:diaminobutyrate--2-oxoglutarate transaminase [Aquabacterium sp. A7-Y]|uniref:diaminobutyrate--2-oxoglutarate transaminase n=1 Tax=Aquabacterium sp. A7-Y TaxID=1349605 RepID=UPI00223D7CDA|nr:diaminobutyrate--2-oxoglutarate transaminase [Aquabacterium sp. A7-Y]MCW7537584.1 diaminobutyrate--2-oxoglutarate transaminase [Aquabacterium sp. A7-Y]